MRVVLVLAGLGLAVSGCVTAAPIAVAPADPNTAVPDSGLLAAVVLTGGLCPDGVCESGFEVRADGTWIATSGSTTTRGVLPAAVLAVVERAAATTGMASAPPFTGTCPVAYDGSEAVYTWRTPAGAEVTVSACERAVPLSDPLVVALAEAQDATGASPGTTDADQAARADRIAAASVGMPEDQAIALIEGVSSMRMSVRVVSRDGETLPVTDDYAPTRVNLTIVDGVVTRAHIG